MTAFDCVEIKNLSMSYGHKKALTNVSYAIQSGVIVGVAGANGSGKTTLLKILAGLIQPYSGSVIIFGNADTWKSKKDIAYHASNPYFHRESSILQEMALYAKLHRKYDMEMAKQMYRQFGFTIVLGENWIADQLLAASTRYYGDHPWSDITRIDWNALPTSLESAVQRIDQSSWAVVNNPNPTDRLHLRTASQKDASSLGKYYSGTAVRVLDESGEWLHVDVYGVEGWMMKQYLARGEAMNAVMPRGPLPNAATYPIDLYETFDSEYPFYKLTSYGDWLDMRICGVVGDEWYHVWFMGSGRSGYVRQEAFTLEND